MTDDCLAYLDDDEPCDLCGQVWTDGRCDCTPTEGLLMERQDELRRVIERLIGAVEGDLWHTAAWWLEEPRKAETLALARAALESGYVEDVSAQWWWDDMNDKERARLPYAARKTAEERHGNQDAS